MIDWVNVFGNSLWIIGLAGALAGLSYASWESSMREKKFLQTLNQRGYALVFSASGFLFSAGLAVTSFGNWKFLVWTVIAFIFLAYIFFILVGEPSRSE